jgi:molecular chaperone DnaJ
MKKDYYEILGVAKDADLQQVKKSYRSLALKFHPDRVPPEEKKASEEKFKEISEAYGVLSDPQKRKTYDQYGHSGIDQNFTSDDIFRGADFSSVFGESGLGDVFSQLFGEGGFDAFGGQQSGSRRPQRGRDIQYEVDITLEEAYSGVEKKIKVPRNEVCKDCDGSGAKAGTKLQSCSVCGGHGVTMVSSGFFRMQQTCSKCGGRGQIITEYCPGCHGKGMIRVTRNIDVKIPSGVDNNSRLRIQHQGEVAKGGAGDLYLYIHVLEHQTFSRNGNDLYMELPVSFVLAALGSEIDVPALSGDVSMKIPAGTQSGKMFRLRGKGMPDVHSKAHGDQYVKVMIQVPTQLSSEQKRLLEDFSRISGENHQLKNDSIKEKIKKVFK